MQGPHAKLALTVTVGLLILPGPSRGLDPPPDCDDRAGPTAPVIGFLARRPGPRQPWTNVTDTGVLFDNGPFITGPAVNPGSLCFGDQSVLQNAPLCLNLYGYGVQFEAPLDTNLADDFTLTCPVSEVTAITVFAYETGPLFPLPTIVGGDVRIHAGPPPIAPMIPPPVAVSAVLAAPPIFTPTYRQTAVGPDAMLCTRHIVALTFDFAPPVLLPAGTYWITYHLTGGAAAGPWVPPVTIPGMTGKPGANGMQFTLAGGAFIPVTDAGAAGCVPAPPVPNPQDFPFLVHGHTTCYADCNHDCTLTVADFGCFQTSFVTGDEYADCNGNGAFTIADWGCFQTRFVAGCP